MSDIENKCGGSGWQASYDRWGNRTCPVCGCIVKTYACTCCQGHEHVPLHTATAPASAPSGGRDQ
jgi:hypothetical protein